MLPNLKCAPKNKLIWYITSKLFKKVSTIEYLIFLFDISIHSDSFLSNYSLSVSNRFSRNYSVSYRNSFFRYRSLLLESECKKMRQTFEAILARVLIGETSDVTRWKAETYTIPTHVSRFLCDNGFRNYSDFCSKTTF